ncbi:hypothetical protein [Pseudoglutamicibacter cumminsii]|uniref:hypothetical protein n=1 Tax=Pseudoglutamicibacter cumminsii TaxID=156979 RepID=UPI0021A3B4D6|nr:hypothetical protein [Pseudoglutamicibacter cumminsii]MCT1685484.1 hypothetical protein [Pseudoglutamicibacter cumminsii]
MTRNRSTQTHRYHTLPPGISFNRKQARYTVYILRSENGDGREYHVCTMKTLDAAREVRARVLRDIQAYRDPARYGTLEYPTITENHDTGRYEYGGHVYESPFAAIAASGRDYYKRALALGEAGISDEDVVRPDSRLVGSTDETGTECLPVDDTTATTDTDVAVAGEGLWELTDRLETIIAAIRTQLDSTPQAAGLDTITGDGPVWETGHTIYEIERLGSDTHVITRDTGTVEARDGLIFYDATATSPCTPESARRLAAGLVAAANYIEQGRE